MPACDPGIKMVGAKSDHTNIEDYDKAILVVEYFRGMRYRDDDHDCGGNVMLMVMRQAAHGTGAILRGAHERF